MPPTRCSRAEATLASRFGEGADGAVALAREYAPQRQAALARDPDRCMTDTDAPQLSVVAGVYGDKAAAGWLVGQIEDLFKATAVGVKADIETIKSAAEVILSNHSELRVTDIMLFMTRFKGGRYGKFYGSADPLALNDALSRYKEERSAALPRIARRQGRIRQIERRLEWYGETAATLDELMETSMWAAMDEGQRGWCRSFAAFFDARVDSLLDKFRFHLRRKENCALGFTLDRAFHKGHLEAYRRWRGAAAHA